MRSSKLVTRLQKPSIQFIRKINFNYSSTNVFEQKPRINPIAFLPPAIALDQIIPGSDENKSTKVKSSVQAVIKSLKPTTEDEKNFLDRINKLLPIYETLQLSNLQSEQMRDLTWIKLLDPTIPQKTKEKLCEELAITHDAAMPTTYLSLVRMLSVDPAIATAPILLYSSPKVIYDYFKHQKSQNFSEDKNFKKTLKFIFEQPIFSEESKTIFMKNITETLCPKTPFSFLEKIGIMEATPLEVYTINQAFITWEREGLIPLIYDYFDSSTKNLFHEFNDKLNSRIKNPGQLSLKDEFEFLVFEKLLVKHLNDPEKLTPIVIKIKDINSLINIYKRHTLHPFAVLKRHFIEFIRLTQRSHIDDLSFFNNCLAILIKNGYSKENLIKDIDFSLSAEYYASNCSEFESIRKELFSFWLEHSPENIVEIIRAFLELETQDNHIKNFFYYHSEYNISAEVITLLNNKLTLDEFIRFFSKAPEKIQRSLLNDMLKDEAKAFLNIKALVQIYSVQEYHALFPFKLSYLLKSMNPALFKKLNLDPSFWLPNYLTNKLNLDFILLGDDFLTDDFFEKLLSLHDNNAETLTPVVVHTVQIERIFDLYTKHNLDALDMVQRHLIEFAKLTHHHRSKLADLNREFFPHCLTFLIKKGYKKEALVEIIAPLISIEYYAKYLRYFDSINKELFNFWSQHQPKQIIAIMLASLALPNYEHNGSPIKDFFWYLSGCEFSPEILTLINKTLTPDEYIRLFSEAPPKIQQSLLLNLLSDEKNALEKIKLLSTAYVKNHSYSTIFPWQLFQRIKNLNPTLYKKAELDNWVSPDPRTFAILLKHWSPRVLYYPFTENEKDINNIARTLIQIPQDIDELLALHQWKTTPFLFKNLYKFDKEWFLTLLQNTFENKKTLQESLNLLEHCEKAGIDIFEMVDRHPSKTVFLTSLSQAWGEVRHRELVLRLISHYDPALFNTIALNVTISFLNRNTFRELCWHLRLLQETNNDFKFPLKEKEAIANYFQANLSRIFDFPEEMCVLVNFVDNADELILNLLKNSPLLKKESVKNYQWLDNLVRSYGFARVNSRCLDKGFEDYSSYLTKKFGKFPNLLQEIDKAINFYRDFFAKYPYLVDYYTQENFEEALRDSFFDAAKKGNLDVDIKMVCEKSQIPIELIKLIPALKNPTASPLLNHSLLKDSKESHSQAQRSKTPKP